jgi:AcrR family transcriptional regulator
MTTAAATNTRTRILEAALDLFSEHGFEGATLQQIADRLGFTKAAIYYHFPSKDDLLQALNEPAVIDCEQLLAAYEQMPDTPSRRRAFIEAYLEFLMRHRQLIAYMIRDLAVLAHPAIRDGAEERRDRMEALIAGPDRDDFNAQIRTAIVFGGMHAVVAQYPSSDPELLRSAMLDAVGAVLTPPRRTPTRTRQKPESTRSAYAPS